MFSCAEKSVVLTYILKGLDTAVSESDDECEEVINYLKAIQRMQHSNVEIAARIWESNNFKFDHIPSNFLCNKEVSHSKTCCNYHSFLAFYNMSNIKLVLLYRSEHHV